MTGILLELESALFSFATRHGSLVTESMKLMRCPVNGLRPIQEFAYGGTTRPSPDPAASTDREWADYVFCRSGEPGVKKEWWYHIASGTWFIAERDTQTDEIVQTYLFAGE